MYWLNLILKSNQGLALFRKNQILQSTRHKSLQQHDNEDLFIQLLNAWLYFTRNNFPTAKSIEEILGQPLFLNPHIKLDFNFDNLYLYCIVPKNISDKFITIRNICKFLQPRFISSFSFGAKLSLPNTNQNRILYKILYKIVYKFIVYLIRNDWKHILRAKTSQECLLKIFYYNGKGTKKLKNL